MAGVFDSSLIWHKKVNVIIDPVFLQVVRFKHYQSIVQIGVAFLFSLVWWWLLRLPAFKNKFRRVKDQLTTGFHRQR